jgi:hypothetical protein
MGRGRMELIFLKDAKFWPLMALMITNELYLLNQTLSSIRGYLNSLFVNPW